MPRTPPGRPMANDVAIRASGLTRRFGDLVAVDRLDLRVPRRTIYGFLGPNGSGKSTTIRMLCGLLTPSAGSVEVLGHRIPQEAEQLKHKIGYMTQRFSLYDDLSVRENLAFMSRIYCLPKRSRSARIDAALDTYNLTAQARQFAGTLSGGQKQRLALAAATLHEPEILFLDEPTSAVDPQTRRDFWETLFNLVDAGTTILVSTHYMDEAERCHRLAILDRGRVVADDEPDALMANLGAHVVEVETDAAQALRQRLKNQAVVLSVTQLGRRLRVLVRPRVHDPEALIQSQMRNAGIAGNARLTHASLEDVFVITTRHVDRTPEVAA